MYEKLTNQIFKNNSSQSQPLTNNYTISSPIFSEKTTENMLFRHETIITGLLGSLCKEFFLEFIGNSKLDFIIIFNLLIQKCRKETAENSAKS